MNKILSIDVGIKNLAYCILDENKKICDWNVLNLIDETIYCCCLKKNGSPCKSKASFYEIINNKKNGYCKTHTKPELNKIKNRKVKSISIKEISQTLFETLNNYSEMLNVNKVIIENQPCLMNPMIKTVQVLIYSYFIMNGLMNNDSNIIDVQFVNAKNKLSFYDGPPIELFSNNKYTQRKKESIEVCKYMLSDNTQKEFFLSHTKKDDLADSYLQGIWFLLKKTK